MGTAQSPPRSRVARQAAAGLAAGDYLTDGKRLVRILLVHELGIEVEDCSCSWRDTAGEPVFEVSVLKPETLASWRKVTPDGES